MASGNDRVDEVSLHLQVETPPSIDRPERTIRLTRSNPSISFGRASKVESKGILASENNGWFDSPVMSRTHAEMRADFDTKTLYVTDVGSLHGTFVNADNDRLPSNTERVVKQGDLIRFGISIIRGPDNFSPLCVRCGKISYAEIGDENHGAVFNVTADYEEEDFSSDDEDLPKHGGPIDLTTEDVDTTVMHSSIIDLTSSPRPASPVPGKYAQGQMTAQRTEVAVIVDDIDDNYDIDEESIHLTSESEAEVLGTDDDSIAESDDDEEMLIETTDVDEHASSSEDEEMSEGDHSVFETSDEEDAEDDLGEAFIAELGTTRLPPMRIDHMEEPAGSFIHPSVIFAEKYGFSRPTTSQPAPITLPPLIRPPSPTDAVMMPKRMAYSGFQDKTMAEDLGQKTGKQEYFSAREENKMTAMRQANTYPSPPKVEEEPAVKSPPAVIDPQPLAAPQSEGVAQERGSSEKVPTPAPERMRPAAQALGDNVPDHQQEDTQAESSGLLKSGQEFLNSPPEEQPLSYTRSASEEHMTSAFEYHQFKMSTVNSSVAEGSRRWSPRTDGKSTGTVEAKTKRKADEISKSTPNEELWAKRARDLLVSAVPQGTPSRTPEPEILLPITVNVRTERPAKRLATIAERVGYAALGGATVGAMILGGLIYTAPQLV